MLSKLNEDEYGECSVMNKQYLRSVYENKEKCVANGVLLKELCLLMDRILTTHLSRSDICHLIDFIFTGWFYACCVSFCRHCSDFYFKLVLMVAEYQTRTRLTVKYLIILLARAGYPLDLYSNINIVASSSLIRFFLDQWC